MLGNSNCRLDSSAWIRSSLPCASCSIAPIDSPSASSGAASRPCRLRLAHGFGIGVALGAQPIGLDLGRLALLFQGGHFLDVEDETAARQLGGHSGQIAAQQLRIEHDDFLEP